MTRSFDLATIAGQVLGPSNIVIKAIASNIRHLSAEFLARCSFGTGIDAGDGTIVLAEVGIAEHSYLALPKGRNNLATQERLRALGIMAFDPLSTTDCDRIASSVMQMG